MNGLGLGLQEYANDVDHVFGGAHAQSDVESLLKAMEAGTTTPSGESTTGAALKVESLEATLRSLEARKKDYKMWQAVPKLPATNTVEEFNVHTSYGADAGGVYSETETPEEILGSYKRESELIKFYGTKRSVSLAMTMVKTISGVGNVKRHKVEEGTKWLLKRVNRHVAFGNSKLVPEQFNGVFYQHEKALGGTTYNPATYIDSDQVIDLRGAKLDESNFEDAAGEAEAKFASLDTLFAPQTVLSGFVKSFYPDRRFLGPSGNGDTVGRRIRKVETQYGEVDLIHDVFLNGPAVVKNTLAANATKSPSAPTVSAVAAVASDSETKFETAELGDYLYGVVAINKYGESAITVFATAVTVASGNSVDITIAEGGSPTGQTATAYRIYRSGKDETTASTAKFYPLFEVSESERSAGYDGGAANKVRDRNRFMANTHQAFAIENSTDLWAAKQLAPLMKLDLAITGPVYPFLVLMYLMLQVYQPTKVIRFINIGK